MYVHPEVMTRVFVLLLSSFLNVARSSFDRPTPPVGICPSLLYQSDQDVAPPPVCDFPSIPQCQVINATTGSISTLGVIDFDELAPLWANGNGTIASQPCYAICRDLNPSFFTCWACLGTQFKPLESLVPAYQDSWYPSEPLQAVLTWPEWTDANLWASTYTLLPCADPIAQQPFVADTPCARYCNDTERVIYGSQFGVTLISCQVAVPGRFRCSLPSECPWLEPSSPSFTVLGCIVASTVQDTIRDCTTTESLTYCGQQDTGCELHSTFKSNGHGLFTEVVSRRWPCGGEIANAFARLCTREELAQSCFAPDVTRCFQVCEDTDRTVGCRFFRKCVGQTDMDPWNAPEKGNATIQACTQNQAAALCGGVAYPSKQCNVTGCLFNTTSGLLDCQLMDGSCVCPMSSPSFDLPCAIDSIVALCSDANPRVSASALCGVGGDNCTAQCNYDNQNGLAFVGQLGPFTCSPVVDGQQTCSCADGYSQNTLFSSLLCDASERPCVATQWEQCGTYAVGCNYVGVHLDPFCVCANGSSGFSSRGPCSILAGVTTMACDPSLIARCGVSEDVSNCSMGCTSSAGVLQQLLDKFLFPSDLDGIGSLVGGNSKADYLFLLASDQILPSTATSAFGVIALDANTICVHLPTSCDCNFPEQRVIANNTVGNPGAAICMDVVSCSPEQRLMCVDPAACSVILHTIDADTDTCTPFATVTGISLPMRDCLHFCGPSTTSCTTSCQARGVYSTLGYTPSTITNCSYNAADVVCNCKTSRVYGCDGWREACDQTNTMATQTGWDCRPCQKFDILPMACSDLYSNQFCGSAQLQPTDNLADHPHGCQINLFLLSSTGFIAGTCPADYTIRNCTDEEFYVNCGCPGDVSCVMQCLVSDATQCKRFGLCASIIPCTPEQARQFCPILAIQQTCTVLRYTNGSSYQYDYQDGSCACADDTPLINGVCVAGGDRNCTSSVSQKFCGNYSNAVISCTVHNNITDEDHVDCVCDTSTATTPPSIVVNNLYPALQTKACTAILRPCSGASEVVALAGLYAISCSAYCAAYSGNSTQSILGACTLATAACQSYGHLLLDPAVSPLRRVYPGWPTNDLPCGSLSYIITKTLNTNSTFVSAYCSSLGASSATVRFTDSATGGRTTHVVLSCGCDTGFTQTDDGLSCLPGQSCTPTEMAGFCSPDWNACRFRCAGVNSTNCGYVDHPCLHQTTFNGSCPSALNLGVCGQWADPNGCTVGSCASFTFGGGLTDCDSSTVSCGRCLRHSYPVQGAPPCEFDYRLYNCSATQQAAGICNCQMCGLGALACSFRSGADHPAEAETCLCRSAVSDSPIWVNGVCPQGIAIPGCDDASVCGPLTRFTQKFCPDTEAQRTREDLLQCSTLCACEAGGTTLPAINTPTVKLAAGKQCSAYIQSCSTAQLAAFCNCAAQNVKCVSCQVAVSLINPFDQRHIPGSCVIETISQTPLTQYITPPGAGGWFLKTCSYSDATSTDPGVSAEPMFFLNPPVLLQCYRNCTSNAAVLFELLGPWSSLDGRGRLDDGTFPTTGIERRMIPSIVNFRVAYLSATTNTGLSYNDNFPITQACYIKPVKLVCTADAVVYKNQCVRWGEWSGCSQQNATACGFFAAKQRGDDFCRIRTYVVTDSTVDWQKGTNTALTEPPRPIDGDPTARMQSFLHCLCNHHSDGTAPVYHVSTQLTNSSLYSEYFRFDPYVGFNRLFPVSCDVNAREALPGPTGVLQTTSCPRPNPPDTELCRGTTRTSALYPCPTTAFPQPNGQSFDSLPNLAALLYANTIPPISTVPVQDRSTMPCNGHGLCLKLLNQPIGNQVIESDFSDCECVANSWVNELRQVNTNAKITSADFVLSDISRASADALRVLCQFSLGNKPSPLCVSTIIEEGLRNYCRPSPGNPPPEGCGAVISDGQPLFLGDSFNDDGQFTLTYFQDFTKYTKTYTQHARNVTCKCGNEASQTSFIFDPVFGTPITNKASKATITIEWDKNHAQAVNVKPSENIFERLYTRDWNCRTCGFSLAALDALMDGASDAAKRRALVVESAYWHPDVLIADPYGATLATSGPEFWQPITTDYCDCIRHLPDNNPVTSRWHCDCSKWGKAFGAPYRTTLVVPPNTFYNYTGCMCNSGWYGAACEWNTGPEPSRSYYTYLFSTNSTNTTQAPPSYYKSLRMPYPHVFSVKSLSVGLHFGENDRYRATLDQDDALSVLWGADFYRPLKGFDGYSSLRPYGCPQVNINDFYTFGEFDRTGEYNFQLGGGTYRCKTPSTRCSFGGTQQQNSALGSCPVWENNCNHGRITPGLSVDCVCDAGWTQIIPNLNVVGAEEPLYNNDVRFFWYSCSKSLCDLNPDPSAPTMSECSGNGQCLLNSQSQQYQCVCDPAYNTPGCAYPTGTALPTSTSPCFNGGCLPHGTCTKDGLACNCSVAASNTGRWSGSTCNISNCTPACMNNGRCVYSAAIDKFGCVCDLSTGFVGPTCTRSVCPSTSNGVCNGHGTCDTSTGKCCCNSTWSGCACDWNDATYCTAPGGIDTCDGVGVAFSLQPVTTIDTTCIARTARVYGCQFYHPTNTTRAKHCLCDAERSGLYCERNACPLGTNGNPCNLGQAQHTTCNVATSPPTCNCFPNPRQWAVNERVYIGSSCSIDVTEQCTSVFQAGVTLPKRVVCWNGNGDCVFSNTTNAYGCHCKLGFTGKYCEINTCNPAVVNGECVNGIVPACFPTWSGSDCNTSTCATPTISAFDGAQWKCVCANDATLRPPSCVTPLCPTITWTTAANATRVGEECGKRFLPTQATLNTLTCGIEGNCTCGSSNRLQPPTHTGPDALTGLCVPACDPDPSHTVSVSAVGSNPTRPFCVCARGYYPGGDLKFVEIGCREPYCLNGGQFAPGASNAFPSCSCDSGFTGNRCDAVVELRGEPVVVEEPLPAPTPPTTSPTPAPPTSAPTFPLLVDDASPASTPATDDRSLDATSPPPDPFQLDGTNVVADTPTDNFNQFCRLAFFSQDNVTGQVYVTYNDLVSGVYQQAYTQSDIQPPVGEHLTVEISDLSPEAIAALCGFADNFVRELPSISNDTQLNTTTVVLLCNPPWTGPTCSDSLCANGAVTVTSADGQTTTCQCIGMWGGEFCDQDQCAPLGSIDSSNPSWCVCAFPRLGLGCLSSLCEPNGEVNATDDGCSCFGGFTGEICQDCASGYDTPLCTFTLRTIDSLKLVYTSVVAGVTSLALALVVYFLLGPSDSPSELQTRLLSRRRSSITGLH